MPRFEVPAGWTAQSYRYALDPTPAQQRALTGHAGAARFAYNHMLALVKAVMDQRGAERSYGVAEADLTPVQGWSLPALRRTWNVRKHVAAPWWAEHSKEAYNTGLDALARGLDAWAKARSGTRKGPRTGFPRFKAKARARAAVRFTTGAIRIEPDRHHVRLPRLGTIKTHESTRRLARRTQAGTARVLSATVSRDRTGRWYCSFQTLVSAKTRPAHATRSAHPVVGVDLGVRDLTVVATPDGVEVARVPAPRSLAAGQVRLRALQRRASRQRGPDRRTGQVASRRWRRTQARIARVHTRAADVRRDHLHKITTALAQQHQTVVVEDLNVAGMSRSARGTIEQPGRLVRQKAGLNRAILDAAFAELRRQLTYKTTWYGSTLVVADRWYPSSKTCSACGGRKPSLTLAQRKYTCDTCGAVLDRDLNAAINLARLALVTAGSGPVAGRGAIRKTGPASAGPAGGDEASTPHGGAPAVGKTGTAPPQGEAA